MKRFFFCQVYKGYILNYTSIWFLFSEDIKTTSCFIIKGFEQLQITGCALLIRLCSKAVFHKMTGFIEMAAMSF